MQPEALLRDENEMLEFCEEVKNILLAQPLNPLVKLEFEIIPKRNSLGRGLLGRGLVRQEELAA